jgi:hypothetical protein
MLELIILITLMAVFGILGFTIWFVIDDIKKYDDNENNVW